MRSILVMNAKGGSGKTTVSINLASYYAIEGYEVALVDYDPQYCALDWLENRPEAVQRSRESKVCRKVRGSPGAPISSSWTHRRPPTGVP